MSDDQDGCEWVSFFWYRPTQVVLDQRPLNGCVCVCVCVCLLPPVKDSLRWQLDSAACLRGSFLFTRCILAASKNDAEMQNSAAETYHTFALRIALDDAVAS